MKNECKIIQDLLPNYIENLTSYETNEYIEHHMKQCDKCKKIFEDMKNHLSSNNEHTTNKKEINYIKKYSKRITVLKTTIIITLILIVAFGIFAGTIGKRISIQLDLSQKAYEKEKEANYYFKAEFYKDEILTSKVETYYKEGKYIVYSNHELINQVFYKSDDEELFLLDNGKAKVYDINGIVRTNPEGPMPLYVGSFWNCLQTAINSNFKIINIDGKDCYILDMATGEYKREQYVDIETGTIIKIVDRKNNARVEYYYEVGIVKDSDVARPDLTEYTLRNGKK